MSPQLRDIRTDIGLDRVPFVCILLLSYAPAAVIGVRQEVGVFPDRLEGFQDDVLASSVIGAEPLCKSLRLRISALEVGVGLGNSLLGEFTSDNNARPLFGRAVDVFVAPLVVDMPGSCEITRAFGLRNTINSGVQVLGDAISIDVDGVVSGAGSSGVVCGRDCESFHELMPDESKAIEIILRS